MFQTFVPGDCTQPAGGPPRPPPDGPEAKRAPLTPVCEKAVPAGQPGDAKFS